MPLKCMCVYAQKETGWFLWVCFHKLQHTACNGCSFSFPDQAVGCKELSRSRHGHSPRFAICCVMFLRKMGPSLSPCALPFQVFPILSALLNNTPENALLRPRCECPPKADGGRDSQVQFPKGNQPGAWTAVHQSKHGARFPGVPEEITTATYHPFPWPSWISGAMTSPSTNSVTMPEFPSLICGEMRTKIITTYFAFIKIITLVLQNTQVFLLFLE